MDSTPKATGLLSLPAELILHILSYLEPLDLADVAQTCRGLQSQSYDDSVWQPLVNEIISSPIDHPHPLESFRELYIAHHPYWFLVKQNIWFSDVRPSGKLLISRFEPDTGSIAAYTVTATPGRPNWHVWENNPNVIIHSFNPKVSLDFCTQVVKLDPHGTTKPDSDGGDHWAHDQNGQLTRYGRERPMDVFPADGPYASLMLCRALPSPAIAENTAVWPPLRIPAVSRTRNLSGDDYTSLGHRPTTLSQISTTNFRLRIWAEYTGRTGNSGPGPTSTLANAFGRMAPYFAARLSTNGGGRVSIKRSGPVATFATLPESAYVPTKAKPWQGIWCGDYSAHGCEFLLVRQVDEGEAGPLPEGMGYLRTWFETGLRGWRSNFFDAGVAYGEPIDPDAGSDEQSAAATTVAAPLPELDSQYPPSGRIEAIKLTGDANIPRGEYTWIAPDIGPRGLVRIADEGQFQGARVVRSAGHVAHEHFINDQYQPSQLIMISHDRLAQFWETMGHISYYQRVDLEALKNIAVPNEE